MSVTWNSSKQSSHASSAIAAAVRSIGSSFVAVLSWRKACTRSCTSAMNSWKCARRLRSTGAGLEEQVHQHGLAAADLAVDVETLDRLRFLALAEQPAERRRFARQPVLRQRIFQPLEMADQRVLRGSASISPAATSASIAFARGRLASGCGAERITRFDHIRPAADRSARREQHEAATPETAARGTGRARQDIRRRRGSTRRAAAPASRAACICGLPAQARCAASGAPARPAPPSAPAMARRSRPPRAASCCRTMSVRRGATQTARAAPGRAATRPHARCRRRRRR